MLIDCQNTYREGIMQLEGVEPALKQCAKLLQRARDAGAPVIHIQHDAGPGTPYDVRAPIGAIADIVAPAAGETVIVKAYPSSFEQTDLDAELKKLGVTDLVHRRLHDARVRELDGAGSVQPRLPGHRRRQRDCDPRAGEPGGRRVSAERCTTAP